MYLDPDTHVSCPAASESLITRELQKKISDLKLEVSVSEEMARKIEVERSNLKWLEKRQFRLSIFVWTCKIPQRSHCSK